MPTSSIEAKLDGLHLIFSDTLFTFTVVVYDTAASNQCYFTKEGLNLSRCLFRSEISSIDGVGMNHKKWCKSENDGEK